MKRLLSVLLCMIFALSVFPLAVSAENATSGKCGDNVTWEFDGATGTLTISGEREMEDYYYYGPPAYAPWYEIKDSIKKVVVCSGVTSIGNSSFEGCTSLTSMTIPGSVTKIGYDAFEDCYKLNYNVYDNAKYLGNEANPYYALIKASDSNITSCDIHKDTRIIAAAAFAECESLESVTIPEGVTEIGEDAFEGCTSLKSVTIPESVTEISYRAFSECTSLESMTIPESVTEIGYGAFSECESLGSVTIPEGVTEIGGYAFSGCTSLESVTIPEGVSNIRECTFRDCSSLKNVTIPEGVTSIIRSAFQGCTSLESVTIPESVTKIFDGAFSECGELSDVYYSGSESQWNKIDFGKGSQLMKAEIHFAKEDSETGAPETENPKAAPAKENDGAGTVPIWVWVAIGAAVVAAAAIAAVIIIKKKKGAPKDTSDKR